MSLRLSAPFIAIERPDPNADPRLWIVDSSVADEDRTQEDLDRAKRDIDLMMNILGHLVDRWRADHPESKPTPSEPSHG